MIVALLLSIAMNVNPPEVEEMIRCGLGYAYTEQFDSAGIYFSEVMKNHPENPAGYFMNAALLQLKMMDECRFDEEEKYFDLMRKAIRYAEIMLEEEEDSWARFYLANAYVYQAVYKGFRRDYFETFTLGVKGGRMMQDLIRKDSTFYDAYLAAGTFEYFWARATKYLPFLNLAGGDVAGAIEKLHIAAQRSIYSGPTARNSLVFIYGEEGEYEKAAAMIDSLLTEYPTSRTFLWNKADLEFKRENYSDAALIFEDLYHQYDVQNDKNYANLAQCRLYIGKCFAGMGDKNEARKNLKEVIKFKEFSASYPQINGYCREAYTLLNRLL